MHQSKYMSLATIAFALLFALTSASKKDLDIGNLLTDMEITNEQLEELLLDREIEVFSTRRTTDTNGETFFASFSSADMIKVINSTGIKDRQALDAEITNLLKVYDAEVKNKNFENFLRDVKPLINSYLIYQNIVLGKEMGSQDFVLNYNQNVKTKTKVYDPNQANRYKKPYDHYVELNKIISSQYAESIKFIKSLNFLVDSDNLKLACSNDTPLDIKTNSMNILKKKLELFNQYQPVSYIYEIYDVFTKTLLDINNAEMIENCKDYIQESILSLVNWMKQDQSKDTNSEFIKLLGLNYHKIYNTGVKLSSNIGYFNLLQKKVNQVGLNLKGLQHQDEYVKNASILNFLEYLGSYFAQALNKDNQIQDELIFDNKDFDIIVYNYPYVIKKMINHSQLFDRIFDVFELLEDENIKEISDDKLFNFINLLIRIDAINSQIDKNSFVELAVEVIEKLHHDSMNSYEAELETLFPVKIRENYELFLKLAKITVPQKQN